MDPMSILVESSVESRELAEMLYKAEVDQVRDRATYSLAQTKMLAWWSQSVTDNERPGWLQRQPSSGSSS